MSIETTLEEREKTHGDFKCVAFTSSKMYDLVTQGVSYPKLNFVQKEALRMIIHKVARIAEGDPAHKDHWEDIVGYATLAQSNPFTLVLPDRY